MRPTRTTALVFAAVTLAATAANPSPAAAFFFPLPFLLGPPRAMTINPHRGPTDSMDRGYTVKPGKAWTGTGSRDEDSKSSKASTKTSSKGEDGKSSGSGKGAKSATKAEANANAGHGGRQGAKSATKAEANASSGHGGQQTQRRRSVEHEPSKSSGPDANSETQGTSLTGTNNNIGDFDENLGEARIDDKVQQPSK